MSNTELWIRNGYAVEDIHSLRFQFVYTEEEVKQNRKAYETLSRDDNFKAALKRSAAMDEVMAAIAKRFACYQYEKDSALMFDSPDWDFFFWCNSFLNIFPGMGNSDRDYSYFTLSFNERQNATQHRKLCERLLAFLRERYEEEPHLEVTIQYTTAVNKEKAARDAALFRRLLNGRKCVYTGFQGSLQLVGDHLCFRKKYARALYRVGDWGILRLAAQLGVQSPSEPASDSDAVVPMLEVAR